MDARPRHPRAQARSVPRLVPARIPFVVLLAGLVVAACGPGATTPPSPAATPAATASPATAFPATLTDDEGTVVELPAEPARIVTLTPAATEILFALGLGDRVVGKVEDFALHPPEAAAVPDMAKFGSVDVEAIVAAEADLVIAGGDNFNPPESIERLRSLGIPVLVLLSRDVAGALDDFALLGAATGSVEEAATLAGDVRAAFDAVRAATTGLPAPRVFYELDASSGYFGPAPDSFVAEMIRIAGGDPLTSGTPGVYQVEAEAIVAFDPQVILLGDAAYGVTPEQVKARPGWEGLAAVTSDAIRPIDDVIVTRPGPRLADGIRALALAINPELDLP